MTDDEKVMAEFVWRRLGVNQKKMIGAMVERDGKLPPNLIIVNEANTKVVLESLVRGGLATHDVYGGGWPKLTSVGYKVWEVRSWKVREIRR